MLFEYPTDIAGELFSDTELLKQMRPRIKFEFSDNHLHAYESATQSTFNLATINRNCHMHIVAYCGGFFSNVLAIVKFRLSCKVHVQNS